MSMDQQKAAAAAAALAAELDAQSDDPMVERIAELEAEAAQAKQEVKGLQKKLVSLQKQVTEASGLRHEVDLMKALVADANDAEQETRQANERLRLELESLRCAPQGSDAAPKYSAGTDPETGAGAQLQVELDASKAREAEQAGEIQQLREQLAAALQSKADIRKDAERQVTEEKNKHQQLIHENGKLRTQVDEAANKVAENVRKDAEAATAIHEVREQLAAAIESNAELQRTADRQEAEAHDEQKRLLVENNDLRKDLEAAKQALEESREKAKAELQRTADRQVVEARDQQERLLGENGKLRKELEAAQQALGEARKNAEAELEKMVHELSDGDVTAKYAKAIRDTNEWRKLVLEEQQRCEELQEQLTTALRAEREAKRAEREARMAIKSAASKESADASLHREVETLKAKLAEQQKEVDEEATEVVQLRSECESLRRTVAEQQRAILEIEYRARLSTALQEECSRLRGELETCRSQLAVARAAAERLAETRPPFQSGPSPLLLSLLEPPASGGLEPLEEASSGSLGVEDCAKAPIADSAGGTGVAELREECSKLRAEVAELKQTAQQEAGALGQVQQECEDLRHQLAEKEADSKAKEVKQLQHECDRLRAELKAARSQLTVARAAAETSAETRPPFQSGPSPLLRSLLQPPAGEGLTPIAAPSSGFVGVEEDCAKAPMAHNAGGTGAVELREECSKLRAEVAELKQTAQQGAGALGQVQEECEDLRHQLAEQKQTLLEADSKMKEAEQLQHECDRLREELDVARQQGARAVHGTGHEEETAAKHELDATREQLGATAQVWQERVSSIKPGAEPVGSHMEAGSSTTSEKRTARDNPACWSFLFGSSR